MENNILSWAVGIIGALFTFLTVVAMAYINHVNNRFVAHETKNEKEVKDIHSKFDKYLKTEDFKDFKTEIMEGQKKIFDEIKEITKMLYEKENRK